MIKLFKPVLNEEVINQELPKVFASGMIGTGPKCDLLTNELKKRFTRDEVLLTNSCTSSLTLALTLIKERIQIEGGWNGLAGKKYIYHSPLTCFASTASIIRSGWRPEWIDLDPDTLCMDMNDLEAKLDGYVRAVMWTSWGGALPDFERFRAIKAKYEAKYGHKLYFIFDLAHAYGSHYLGYQIPYFLKDDFFHCYSFGPIKTLTCGGSGGALVCPADFYDEAEQRLWYGLSRKTKCDFRAFSDITHIGSKWNSDDIAATIGLSNLLVVQNAIKHAQENADHYLRTIKNDFVKLLPHKTYSWSSTWLFSILVDNRDNFIRYMAENGIESNGIHRANHTLTCCRPYYQNLSNYETIKESYTCIPVGVHLTWDDIKHIVKTVNNYKGN